MPCFPILWIITAPYMKLTTVIGTDADDLIFANNLSMIRSNLLIGKLAGIAG